MTLVCVLSYSSYGQDVKSIDLKLFSSIELLNYDVHSVLDMRSDTLTVGEIRDELSGKQIKINARGGLAASYTRFLRFAVKQHGEATPVALYITKLYVQGKDKNTAIETGFAFYKDGALLTEFTGTASAGSGIAAEMNAEQLIREALEQALKSFDSWWAKNKETAHIDGSARFKILLEESPKQPGYLGVKKAGKLTWADFQGVPPTGLTDEKALTSSGINLHYETEKEGSKTNVKVIVTPFFNTQKSWVKGGATDLILLHEQQHFLITLMEACYLTERLKKAKLHTDDYEQKVQALFAQALDNIKKRQASYDAETRHSMDMMKQRFWNAHLLNEVTEYGCFSLHITPSLRP